ncbi:hypothetical protein EK21DRAFT_84186 [Setomelanomma holmii]|uniref:DUF7730 domain-containing protein n=1 Tax=Setomelanomma holmii TaxID=210430 RepID=A0A9P4LRW7_9PLEO|nr:hypothetical protein EK21DRAFT_84186 [Setomelanomma holmii]
MDEHPHSAISLRNQAASPLLRLPAELRNKIFEHVLGGYDIFVGIWPRHMERRLDRPFDSFREGGSHFLGLLQVCQQIYTEAKTLPFSLNEFSGWVGGLTRLSFDSNLSENQINKIRVVTIRLKYCGIGFYRYSQDPIDLTPSFVELLHFVQNLKKFEKLKIDRYWDDTMMSRVMDSMWDTFDVEFREKLRRGEVVVKHKICCICCSQSQLPPSDLDTVSPRPRSHHGFAPQRRHASPLLRLPAELRDIIYKFALGGYEIYLGTIRLS